ncbi:hypothetical protein [Streptomyces mirabilis]|uniref:hypothetical protein n=1 Tax=Streptomyces mirabilis TaxID=68239 RepID=UPI00368408AD
MELSTPAGLESLTRSVAEQLCADRIEQDGDTGRVRVVYADGRALELVPNRPRTRITVTAVLPEQATAHGIEVKAITVTALPRPRPSETQAKATARHTADHIRQRLLPAHTAALAELRERTAPRSSPATRVTAVSASGNYMTVGKVGRPRTTASFSGLSWTCTRPALGLTGSALGLWLPSGSADAPCRGVVGGNVSHRG